MRLAAQPSDVAGSKGTRRLVASIDSSLTAHHDAYGHLPVNRHGLAAASDLAHRVDVAGLRGRGGGWFPTARKMQAVAGQVKRRRQRPVVIANGMEGEPASHKDSLLLTRSPHLVLDGLQLMAQTMGARDAFLAVPAGSPAIPVLQLAMLERSSAKLDAKQPKLLIGPDRYVASEESALANAAGGGQQLPQFAPRRHESGLGRRPTLVNNVETLAHLACIARYGPEWFRQLGTTASPGTTLVTVSGIVQNPAVLEITVGTTVSDILSSVGGTTQPLQACLTGGFGGTWVAASAATAGWSPEGLTDAGGVVGASVLGVIGHGTCGLAETSRIMWWLASQSAGQCGPCRFGLAAVAASLGQLTALADPVTAHERLRHQLGLIPGRGACRHPDGATRLARSALHVFSGEVDHHLHGRCTAPQSRCELQVPAPGIVPARQPKRGR